MPHTPGPWDLAKPDKEFLAYVAECSGLSPDKDKYEARVICVEDDDGKPVVVALLGPGPKADPNGRLIAAAPDLLAACKSVTDWFPGDGGTTPMGRTLLALKQAIAKAEGK